MIASDRERYQHYLCSREWNVLREQVRERCSGWCERCFINEMYAVHHKTYIRKYREHLTDLIGVCDECHKWYHAKNKQPNVREISKSIYLAGKISGTDWRRQILRPIEPRDCDDLWPVEKKAIRIQSNAGEPVFLFDYCGPFFKEFDNHYHSYWSERDEVSRNCIHSISMCDLFFAWIDSTDCYGTLVEIGIAKALNKKVFVCTHDEFDSTEMWFAKTCSQHGRSFSPGKALEVILIHELRSGFGRVDLSNIT